MPDIQGSHIDSQPPTLEQQSVREVIKSMKRDPTRKGFCAIGSDGVLRTFAADRVTILDAQGLSPAQIKEFLDSGPYDPNAEAAFRGVDGRRVTSHEGLFEPDPSILPKPMDAEERAARRRLVEEGKRRQEPETADDLGSCSREPVSNHNLDPE